jgi:hypothetical protein
MPCTDKARFFYFRNVSALFLSCAHCLMLLVRCCEAQGPGSSLWVANQSDTLFAPVLKLQVNERLCVLDPIKHGILKYVTVP